MTKLGLCQAGLMIGVFRGDADDDVKVRGELANFRALQRIEIDDQRVSRVLILNPLQQSVASVLRFRSIKALRCDDSFASIVDGNVNMWRAPRISDRFDGCLLYTSPSPRDS